MKRNEGFFAILCGLEAGYPYSDLSSDILSKIVKVDEEKRIRTNYYEYLIFGNFDAMVIGNCPCQSDLLRIVNMGTLLKSYGYSLHFGNIIFSQIDDFKCLKDEYPIIAIAFLKMNSEPQLLTNLLKKNLDHTNIKYILIQSMGWEDFILIHFSNSFSNISKGIQKLKQQISSQASSSRINFTYSIYGTLFLDNDDVNDKIISKASDDSSDKQYIEINIRVELGAYNSVERIIKKELKDVKADLFYIPGKYDLNYRLKEPLTSRAFLTFFFKQFMPNVIRPQQRLIRRTETNFLFDICPPIINNINAQSPPSENNIHNNFENSSQDFNLDDKLEIIKGYFPEHLAPNIKSLYELLKTINNNDLLQKDFKIKFSAFKNYILYLYDKIYSRDYRDIRSIISETPLFLNNFELSIRDIYRGNFPIDDAISFSSYNFRGSYNKFIIALEFLCNIWYGEICKRLPASYQPYSSIFKCTFFFFIGNAVTARITPFRFPVASINTPANIVFFPEDIFYVFHEVGHRFVISYITSYSKVYKIQLDITKENAQFLRDILADLFAIFVFFKRGHFTYPELAKNYFIKTQPPLIIYPHGTRWNHILNLQKSLQKNKYNTTSKKIMSILPAPVNPAKSRMILEDFIENYLNLLHNLAQKLFDSGNPVLKELLEEYKTFSEAILDNRGPGHDKKSYRNILRREFIFNKFLSLAELLHGTLNI